MEAKEYPILFSGEMVRALLAGRKTQTRRLSESWMKVKAGDRLWVRETWATEKLMDPFRPVDIPAQYQNYYGEKPFIAYKADGPVDAGKTRTSLHMPRWASRITLEATADARRERLQDIDREGALSEGIQVLPLQSADDPSAWYQSSPGVNQARTPQDSFRKLWESLHGETAPWASNPMVTVISFRVVA